MGVARASVDELITDYEDFLRQRNLIIFPKTHPQTQTFRQVLFHLSHLSNLSDLGDLKQKLVLPEVPQESANLLLTASHMTSYLLFRQIHALEDKFLKEGGFTENLYKRRISFRSHK